MDATHVFTAYLKNSVTRSVEPLRVIDWRMAADCFVGGMPVSVSVPDLRRISQFKSDHVAAAALVPPLCNPIQRPPRQTSPSYRAQVKSSKISS